MGTATVSGCRCKIIQEIVHATFKWMNAAWKVEDEYCEKEKQWRINESVPSDMQLEDIQPTKKKVEEWYFYFAASS